VYFALFYDTVDNFTERRQPYRAEHLALAERAHREGRLLLGGAFNPPDGALLVFRTSDRAAVEDFAKNDPYVAKGLVRGWRVREWNVVIGAGNA